MSSAFSFPWLAFGTPNISWRLVFCLGIKDQLVVEEDPMFPHLAGESVYMGNSLITVPGFSPAKKRWKWPQRRNNSVFPSIPTPYYDDYDHVYIS